MKFILLAILSGLVQGVNGQPAGSGETVPPVTNVRSVFLIGDAGEPPATTKPILLALRAEVQRSGRQSVVVFLGDNVYPQGLPRPESPGRRAAEASLDAQLAAVRDLTERVYFIPGNHDWQQGGRQGFTQALNQEAYVLAHGAHFLPTGGCPGPVEIPLDSTLTLIALNTQWFLHPWNKPGRGETGQRSVSDNTECAVGTPDEVLAQLDVLLRRNQTKRVLIVGHHPLWSNGEHGGHFTARDHLFPLTNVRSWLWVPLPGLGSIYPLYRQTLGNAQDVAHPAYQRFRRAVADLLGRYPNALYASGHDHNLQLLRREGVWQIVSGAGAKVQPVRKGGYARYAAARRGFGRVDVAPNQVARVQFWAEDGDAIKPTFGQELTGSLPVAHPAQPVETPVAGDASLGAGRFKQVIWGKNYRQLWQAPIDVPQLWVSRRGLTPQVLGGGLQTLSLRLTDSTGRVYTLRQIHKYPEKSIPAVIRSRFLEEVVKDQISGSHPYGSLVVPRLAQAAGLPYTHPQLVLVADDPALGEYRSLFAGSQALLEEHVEAASVDLLGSSWSSQPEQVVSTPKLLRKLHDDSGNQVDGRQLLRARLFDMWIGDWDRHDDQWKWAGFRTPTGWRYEAIPRDRDQAFFRADGLTHTFSRRWLLPKLEGFRSTIHYVPGLNTSGIPIDRTFLTGLSWADWQRVTGELQAQLTDSVITRAVADLPEPAYALTGATIAANLRRRRTDWPAYARTHYLFLARTPEVVGSDQSERFVVERLTDGSTRVTGRQLRPGKPEKAPFFDRTFLPAETAEIRIYGLGGADQFVVRGGAERGMPVRLIGGDGADQFVDSSRVTRGRRHTLVYDRADSTTTLTKGPETADHTSRHADVNQYERVTIRGDVAAQMTAVFDVWQPLLSVNANPDDGLLLGGGVRYRQHGFRKDPFATQQQLVGNVAFATGAFNFSYRGLFADVLRRTDLRLRADVNAPNFVRNFFGFGNETPFENRDQIGSYRARFQNYSVEGLLVRKIRQRNELYGGLLFQRARLLDRPDKYTSELAATGQLPADAFGPKWYAGVRAGWAFDSRNNAILPNRGVTFRTDYTGLKNGNAGASDYHFVQANVAWWLSAHPQARLVLANRTGLEHVLGNHYEVFQAATLGGLTNLRGYRRYRFAGQTAVYTNTDLRLRLFTLKTYLFPAPVGVLGFYDVGRVWQPGEASSRWHQGAGAGIWLAPFSRSILSFQYAFSAEGAIPLLRTGFLF